MPHARPVNEPPLAHAKSARPAHLLRTQNLLAASGKSHRKLQNVRKVRTVLCGGFEHQTRRKSHSVREHPPAQLTLLRLGFQHRRGFAESARSGKDGAAPTFFRGKIRAGVCAGPVARVDHAECRTALRPGSLRGSPEGLAVRQNARVTDPVASLGRARAARAWGADGSRGESARRPGSTPRVRRSTGRWPESGYEPGGADTLPLGRGRSRVSARLGITRRRRPPG